MVLLYVDCDKKRAYATTKNYTDKIQILFHIAGSQNCVLTVQLLRLLLNFMDHKPHGNKESEQPCYYNSVKIGDIFHSLKTVSLLHSKSQDSLAASNHRVILSPN